MKFVEPEVRLISRPHIDWAAIEQYLLSVGATGDWFDARAFGDESPGQDLTEIAGRVCYRSWEPGLNANVTKTRTIQGDYLENILKSGHGSVLEHANYTFSLRNVSRVLTAELNRHKAGTAISQESLRYVRLTDIPIWLPQWAKDDPVLLDAIKSHLLREEEFQEWLTGYFDFHGTDVSFARKKLWTSFMRRFAPGGVTTDEIWTANIRALRHVIETRTAPGAEEEIRLVFGKVAEIMVEESPLLFGDFRRMEDGTWVPKWRKV
jgi:thymidylate synthase (FAD)